LRAKIHFERSDDTVNHNTLKANPIWRTSTSLLWPVEQESVEVTGFAMTELIDQVPVASAKHPGVFLGCYGIRLLILHRLRFQYNIASTIANSRGHPYFARVIPTLPSYWQRNANECGMGCFNCIQQISLSPRRILQLR
jgi:hypothetical protein